MSADAEKDGNNWDRARQTFRRRKFGPAPRRLFHSYPKWPRKNHALDEGRYSCRRHEIRNGWVFTTKTGLYGANYIQRALITAIGLGANRPQDAVYPTSEGPSILSSYTGEKNYVMHFDKGPASARKGFLVADDVR